MLEDTVKGISDAALAAVVRMSRTRANYWAELAIDGALGVAWTAIGWRSGELRPGAALFTVLFGLLLFSLMEYCFHRWLLHGAVRLMKQGHEAHHRSPLEYDSLPFFLPALVLLALTAVFERMMPAGYAFLLAGTLIFGYVAYGLGHFAIHHARFRRAAPRRWAGRHHIHHRHPDRNFGVTTPLWDAVLGTRYVSAAHRRVSD